MRSPCQEADDARLRPMRQSSLDDREFLARVEEKQLGHVSDFRWSADLTTDSRRLHAPRAARHLRCRNGKEPEVASRRPEWKAHLAERDGYVKRTSTPARRQQFAGDHSDRMQYA